LKFQHIQILNVSFRFDEKQTLIGRLATKNGRIYFEYDAQFLKSNTQISPYRLPLQNGLIQNTDTTFDGLFGVFNDSLPDGWGKLLVDRALRARNVAFESLTPLDRLSFVGNRGMGALAYSPEQHFEAPSAITVDLQSLAKEINEVISGTASEVIEKLQVFGGSSAGARPKILVGYNRSSNSLISGVDELSTDYEAWIIKFPSSSDPEDIAQIEQAYAIMAKLAQIQMSETQLFTSGMKQFFGTKRFDCENGKRLHVHTAAGLLHSSHRYPSLDYRDLMSLTWRLTEDFREMEKVFRLCCFNVLAHNRDDHSKNFSFLMDQKGEWKFAPAYDLTFSFGPGGEQSTTVMGEGKNPTMKHLFELADEFQIKKPSIVINEVRESINQWPKIADNSGVTSESKKLIAKHLQG